MQRDEGRLCEGRIDWREESLINSLLLPFGALNLTILCEVAVVLCGPEDGRRVKLAGDNSWLGLFALCCFRPHKPAPASH